MKKVVAIMMALVMVLCFAACSNDEAADTTSEQTDSEYVKEKRHTCCRYY